MNFSFDIDGTLTNYPEHWLAFIDLNLGRKFKSVNEAKEELGISVYSQIKHEYRLSEYKFQEPIRESLIELSQKIYDYKNFIYVHSSRPFSKYPQMLSKTSKWLESSGFRFENVDSKNLQNFVKYRIDYHVENEIEHCYSLLKTDFLKGIFLIDQPVNTFIEEKRIIKIELELLGSYIFDTVLTQVEGG
jgi:hypothetical protein